VRIPRATPVRAIAARSGGAEDWRMVYVWSILGFLLLVVWVITIVDIFRSHLDGKHTAAWLLIVVLLPFVGAIGYWVMRKPPAGEAEQAALAQQSLREEAARRPVSGV
jgi:type VI protein secretion system component VasK